MRKVFTFLVTILLTTSVFAQSPEKMSYQAVVRDAANKLVINQAIGMQISILQGSVSGTEVYIETHSPTSNANGLVSVEIGSGTIVSGDFASIDWANGPYFIKTETDPTGGTNYTIIGTNQLVSVPYALHAKTAETVTNETDPLFVASPANGITSGDIINWNNKLDVEQDSSVTNEIQALSISNDTVYLSNGGFVKLPAGFDGQYSSLTGVPTNVSTFTNDAGYLNSDTTIWKKDSNNIYYNSGKVGLGTSNPGGILDIAGGFIRIQASDNVPIGNVNALEMGYFTTGGYAFLQGYNRGTSTFLPIEFSGSTVGFRANGNTIMKIISNGNVGIGTITPVAKLDVRGNAKFGASNMINIWEWDGVEKIGIDYNTSNGDFNMRNPIAGKRLLATISTTGSWGVENTSGTELMRLTGNGNLGIGTLTPSTKLDVNGVITATGGNSTNWNTAYSWGNHAAAGYLINEVDSSVTNEIQALSISNDTIYLSNGGFVKLPVPSHYIGESYGGGIVFYVDHTGQHGLIVSMIDLTTVGFSNVNSLIGTTAQSDWNGLQNSNAIVSQSGHSSSMADVCLNYSNNDYGTGVFSDWYLPSIGELNDLFANIRLVQKALDSDGNPATQLISHQFYVSSSEKDSNYAWGRYFFNIGTYNDGDAPLPKASPYPFRAIRSF